MNNILVLPMILPILAGVVFVFFRSHIYLQRWISFAVMIANVGISLYLLHRIQSEGILTFDFGGWEPPYGIVFVADSFSVLFILMTSIVAAICLLYAFSSISKDHEKMFFYSFVNFLIAGVNGSFLTGDLFNLYVCFELMLIASYVLVTLGGRTVQLKESIKYVVINVISSWFFLVAIAYLYGKVGTLNMAHLSERISESGQTPLLTIISIVFLMVFALKSGLLLYYWVPGSYSVPPVAVAALFGALLTKVGVYAMFRVFTLLFYHHPGATHRLIGVLAALTLIGGSIGAIAYKDIRKIVTYNVVISIGFIFVGIAVSTSDAIQGSIYYVLHDMIVKGLLFLLAGTMIYVTGTTRIDRMSGLMRNYQSLGWMVFIVMLSLTGIPPFSGFIGKVLVGQGAVESGAYILVGLAFLSSIFVLYSILRIFLNAFWGETMISKEDEVPLKKGWLMPCVLLTAATVGLGLGADSLAAYVSDAAQTLLHPDIYIDAVLNRS